MPPPSSAARLGHGALDLGVVAGVGDDGDDPAAEGRAQLGRGRGEALAVAREEGDVGAFARQGAGHRLADAAAAAGDERALALELEIHAIPRESGCGDASRGSALSADRARSRGRAAAAAGGCGRPMTPAATRLA